MSDDYLNRIGSLIRDARVMRGMSQSELASVLETSQDAVTRIESGKQNLTLDSLAKISEALNTEFLSFGKSGVDGAVHLRIDGGKKLEVRGSIGPFGRTQTWTRVQ